MKNILIFFGLLFSLTSYGQEITSDTTSRPTKASRQVLSGLSDGVLYSKGKTGNALIYGTRVFSSVREMQTFTAPREGVEYRLSEKGREGTFVYDAKDTSVDDGGCTVVTSNGKRFKRVFDGAINLSWFGALNDASLLKAIDASQNGKKQILIAGRFVLSSRISIPDNVQIIGQGDSSVVYYTNSSALLTIRNRTVVAGFRIKGIRNLTYAIASENATSQKDWIIRNNVFDSTFINPVYIQGTTNNDSHRGEILGNTFFYPRDNATVITRLDDSRISGNVVYSRATGRGIMLFGGKRNVITGNYIYNGIVGISFAYQKTTAGARGIVEDNTISGNIIKGVSEESISLDGRYNEPSNMACMEYAGITGKFVSGPSRYITLSGNWAGSTMSYYNYYVCFAKGSMAGYSAKVIGHSAGTANMAIQITPAQYDLITVGDSVVVGAPFLRTTIEGNVIESVSKTAAIYLYGMCFDSVVLTNKITYVGTGAQAQANMPLAGIAISSVDGINPTGSITGVRKAPSMRNVVDKANTYNCSIQINMIKYGTAKGFRSYGNYIINSTASGSDIAVDYSEDNVVNCHATFGITVKNPIPKPSGKVQSGAGAPTLVELPKPGDAILWKSTTDSTVRWYINDGNKIKAGSAFN